MFKSWVSVAVFIR